MGGGGAEQIARLQATEDLFRVFGVAPVLGRGFFPEEDQIGRHRVVILSDAFWRSHFGAAPDVIGRTMQLNGEAYAIVGTPV